MISTLERTILGTKDLKEQTPADHVLIVDVGSSAAYYYITSWEHDGHVAEFYHGEDLVYACRLEQGRWAVINTTLTDTFSNEDFARMQVSESEALVELHKKLHPEGHPSAENGGKDTGAETRKDGRGQYL